MSIECLRCGKCCKGCEFLIKTFDVTSCLVYNSRLGRKVKRNKHVCVMRVDQNEIIDGCPYNELINEKKA